MGLGIVFFLLGALVLAVVLFLSAVYRLAKRTPYRTAIRAWVAAVVLEIVAGPVLYGLTDLAFHLSARNPWFYPLLLLLLSMVPALMGLQYDKLRRQVPTLFQPTQKQPPKAPRAIN
ncbi:MAG: hypothetical protein EOO63_08310 [Hymenobacter sp.]|nr:MAG: hypothetical protein EOO63_08310 [Hymenobacter sp.]